MVLSIEKPKGTEELNLRAFDAGWAAFEDDYGDGAKKGKEEEGQGG